MSSEHVEVLRDLRDLSRAAIKAGDWKVDGACDPDAVLRRAWLAVQDAPEVCVSKSAVMGEGWVIYGTDGDNIESLPFEDVQRVRIVKEAGE